MLWCCWLGRRKSIRPVKNLSDEVHSASISCSLIMHWKRLIFGILLGRGSWASLNLPASGIQNTTTDSNHWVSITRWMLSFLDLPAIDKERMLCRLCGHFSSSTMCAYLADARNEPAEPQEKKLTVADILSRNVNAFKKLSVYVEPVLGT